jgi:two-component system response regulator NreC
MSDAKIRVVVLDDHLVVRDAVAACLAQTPGLEVVATAATLREGIAMVKETAPDVVVADMSLEDGNATELLRLARRQRLRVRIVILTGLTDALALAEAVREGAAGYVLKMQSIAELVQAIRAAAAGGRHVSSAVGGQRGLDALETAGFLKLSRREVEIFRLSIKGETAKEIAQKLFVSAKTVETHRGNINRKLGVRTTAEMVKVATAHGIEIAPRLPPEFGALDPQRFSPKTGTDDAFPPPSRS